MRRRNVMLGLVVVLAWGVAGVAGAGEDKNEPPYIILDGRLIPTRIVPPKPQPQRARADAKAGRAAAKARPAAGVSRAAPTAAQEPAEGAEAANQAEDELDGRYPRYPGLQGPYRPYEYMPYAFSYSTYGYYTYREWIVGLEAAREVERRDDQRQFNTRDMNRRRDRVLRSHDEALRIGLEQLRAAEYQKAAIALTLAAELDQSDPACRIHLAQARMALGHYAEGGKALRRALELQPKLVYVPLDLDGYYASESTFDEQVEALAKVAAEGEQPADVHFLLGFMEFQRGRYEPAYAAFRVASRGNAKDTLTAAYLKITKPAARDAGK